MAEPHATAAHGRRGKVLIGLVTGTVVLGLAALLVSTRTTDSAVGHASTTTSLTAPQRPLVLNTFQGGADGWIQLWGDIALRVDPKSAPDGGGSLLLTVNGTGSSAVGTASQANYLKTGDTVIFHIWSSGQPGSVRPFVASDSNALAFASAARLPSTPGWFTLTWTVPRTPSIEGIGFEVVNPGNGSLTLALGHLSWP